MRAQYLGNASLLIETPDVRILTDPWGSEGIYEGSWFTWPSVEVEIGEVDAIWISHLHPDHYDPEWLRGYLRRFPETELWCARHDPPYLQKLMANDGFDVSEFDVELRGGTEIHCLRSGFFPFDNIDSVLLVKSQGKTLFNGSDMPDDKNMLQNVKERGPIDIAFLPHSGAGPFPQCYDMPTELLLQAAAMKASSFTDLWESHLEILEPKFAIPYAGEYLLGGRLGALNHLRGIPDATDMPDAHVLPEGCWVDPDGLEMYRVKPWPGVNERIASLAGARFDYEDDDYGDETLASIQSDLGLAIQRNPVATVKDFFLRLLWGEDLYSWNLKDGKPGSGDPGVDITVDARHLQGLLSRRYHWNNAEIGSHLSYELHPLTLGVVPEVSLYLSHLHV